MGNGDSLEGSPRAVACAGPPCAAATGARRRVGPWPGPYCFPGRARLRDPGAGWSRPRPPSRPCVAALRGRYADGPASWPRHPRAGPDGRTDPPRHPRLSTNSPSRRPRPPRRLRAGLSIHRRGPRRLLPAEGGGAGAGGAPPAAVKSESRFGRTVTLSHASAESESWLGRPVSLGPRPGTAAGSVPCGPSGRLRRHDVAPPGGRPTFQPQSPATRISRGRLGSVAGDSDQSPGPAGGPP